MTINHFNMKQKTTQKYILYDYGQEHLYDINPGANASRFFNHSKKSWYNLKHKPPAQNDSSQKYQTAQKCSYTIKPLQLLLNAFSRPECSKINGNSSVPPERPLKRIQRESSEKVTEKIKEKNGNKGKDDVGQTCSKALGK